MNLKLVLKLCGVCISFLFFLKLNFFCSVGVCVVVF